MSTNARLAEQLLLLARLLELTGADRFRVIAHDKAARAVESYGADVKGCDRSTLLGIEGIGPKMADKIAEFCQSGSIADLKKLQSEVPAGVVELMTLPGVGPKTAAALWKEAGITSPDELDAAIKAGTLAGHKGMGEKTVKKLEAALAQAKAISETAGPGGAARRLPLGLAWAVTERFVVVLREVDGVVGVEPAGSLRRGRETVADIDILVAVTDEAAGRRATEAFVGAVGVRSVIVSGPAKSSVQAAVLADLGRWGKELTGDEIVKGPSIQVDLRVVPPQSWGAALMYFTGSKEHNVAMRERALKRGLTLNEYGLFPHEKGDDDLDAPQRRGVMAVAGATEEVVFAALGLEWVPPEVREARGEIDVYLRGETTGNEAPAPANSNPIKGKKPASDKKIAGGSAKGGSPGTSIRVGKRLIEVGDIKAELHAHTTASDGAMTILELAQKARSRGFHTIAVTDHSKSSAYAGGLSVERLEEHMREVRAANDATDGITILAGSEVDILVDGRLDYDDDLLRRLDVVVASPHSQLKQEPEKAMARMLRAIENPYVHIMGHPTGRLIHQREGLSLDMAAIIAAAVEHNVALEINSHWLRLDLRDSHVRMAVEAGCLIAIDCDVHRPGEFDNIRFGVATARRGWLPPGQCINTWGDEKLHAWLKSKGRA
ncbi:MAG: PHP domain-containing protein [Phycisphaerales bacterium]|nr:PHP domain-containing protein [Phycisphaerales bacterium]